MEIIECGVPRIYAGVIRSKVLDGLVMDLTDIFELEGTKRTDSKD